MKTIKPQHLLLLLPATLVLVLNSGCSNTAAGYNPIVDSPRSAKYAKDVQACQQLAQQRSYLNDDVKTEAAIGAVIGAIAGSEENSETALGGAIVGGLAGASGRALDTRDERKKIVIECMKQRGHRAVG